MPFVHYTKKLMTPLKTTIQNHLLFLVAAAVFLMVTLNRGAAEIGISYIRLAEIGLMLFIFSAIVSPKKLRKVDAPGVIIASCIITYHILLFAIMGTNYAADTLRFIGPYFYILYFVAGISFYKHLSLAHIINFLSLTFKAVVILGALKPVIVVTLYNVVSIRGVSLFGIYGSYYSILVPALGYFLIFRRREKNWHIFVALGVIALLITGSRSGFLSFFAAMVMVGVFTQLRHVLTVSIILIATVAVSLQFVLPQLLEAFAITSRGDLSLSYYTAMFFSIFDPSYGSQAFGESLSGSRGHRLEMWQHVINNVHANNLTTWFGVGFSDPLVDAVFINPHNSYITFLGRGGYIGLILFSILLLHSMNRAISACIQSKRILKRTTGANSLIFDMSVWGSSFVLSQIVSLGFSTVFESPMNAVPMFFFLGLSYSHAGTALRLKNSAIKKT